MFRRSPRNCAREVQKLAKVDNAWQFSALHANAEKIECFCIEDMAMEIEAEAPVLWGLLDAVLSMGFVVVLLLTKSVNQKANALSSVLGIFLHLTHAPKSVIETMSRMGLSISVHAIHDAIRALSAQSCHVLQYLGQTLLAAYAYDNFDMHLKSTVPTAKKSVDTLKHLTSGLLFPLQHGVTRGDLKCSYELWQKSRINPQAMDVNNSTVAGNIQAIESLMMQGGICDPAEVEDDESPDVLEYIVLVHGDLGTGERIASLQQHWSIEKTPWRQFQHIVFVPGLFHLKMAAADAIWRALIQPTSARQDLTSLMHDIAQLRPRETGIFASKPGFRMMHQLIGHDGICQRLDCWRTEVKHMNNTHETLADFAMTKPSLDELKKIADRLAQEYVATYKLTRARQQPDEGRDKQYENNLLINKYFLLYEELSHAMNVGDIARVETCIIPWALIFKATGKHKYATVMIEFLKNLHFIYPAGLRKAIHYHWLINLTGKTGRFCAVDWCVELNNLFIKTMRHTSLYSVAWIILESPLVEIYRNAHSVIENNFMHTGRTSSHAEPDMKKTFDVLLTKMQSTTPHFPTLGQQSTYSVPDLLDKGHELFEKGTKGVISDVDGATDEVLEQPTAEDIVGEL
ncbi:hypothetical protein C8R48DRAFT_749020 [Suillus tomentosus]|nr:hypothetical protein C8R48DRAFT_749020 [Suillus tomentosus]